MRMREGWKKRALAVALLFAVIATTLAPAAINAVWADDGLVTESTATPESELSGEDLTEPEGAGEETESLDLESESASESGDSRGEDESLLETESSESSESSAEESSFAESSSEEESQESSSESSVESESSSEDESSDEAESSSDESSSETESSEASTEETSSEEETTADETEESTEESSSPATEESAEFESESAAESSPAEESTEDETEESSSDESSSEIESSEASTEETSSEEETTADETEESTEESSAEEESTEAESEPETEPEVVIDEAKVNRYLSIVEQLPSSVTLDNYVSVMQMLSESKDIYDSMTEDEKALWNVFAANQKWKVVLASSYSADVAAVTDGWNLLLKTGGYPSPYEEGGIFLRETGTFGSAFGDWAYDVGSSFRKASNRSKNANAYVQWKNGAYMNDKLYDIKVYYWCPDGDYYVSSSGNMTAHNNGSTQRIFMEFHFFEAGHLGDFNYEVDFYGVMGSRDLDYCGGSEFEGWYFPVSGMGQNDNNSSSVITVYSSPDTVMSIRRDSKIQMTNNTHINGVQQSKTYNFLPYWATTKQSQYGWDDYACLFWTFQSKKSDPMVLAYHTWGSLMAGLNGDPVVVRYYLTADSQRPSGVTLPSVQYTSYGAEFSRFTPANSYKGYTFEGWSLNKNMNMSSENNIKAGMGGLVKASTANISFLRSNGTYAIGEQNGGSVYTLYGKQSNWYGMSLATGLMNGTFEWDEDCGVTYSNGNPSFTPSTYGTNRRILLYGRYKLWTGKVQITKTNAIDSSIKVAGAEYGLYSDSTCTNELARATTNSSGVATFNYTITYNTTYYIKETKAPNNYQLSSTVYTVKADALPSDGGTANINVSDYPWSGKAQVTKISSVNSFTRVPDAVYGLYSDSACETELARATTNASGIATFNYTIYYGKTYYVKEISSPTGYQLNSTVYTVAANALTGNGATANVTASNTPWVGYIRVKKVSSSDNTTPVAGAVYGVYRDVDCTTLEATATTDENGMAVLSGDWYYGSVKYIQELSSPKGYLLNSELYTVNMSELTSHGAYLDVTVTDNPWTGTVELTKYSSVDSSTLIPGAVYGLYTDSACTTKLAEATTDSNGMATFTKKISYGHVYYVKEITAPTGWQVDETVYTVAADSLSANNGKVSLKVYDKPAFFNITTEVVNGTIDSSLAQIPLGENRTINSTANAGYVLKSVTVDGNKIVSGTYIDTSYSYTFSNITNNHTIKVEYVAGGYIEINKTGANSGKPIRNAIYTIYTNSGCTNAVATLETNANGYAKSIPLAPGTYYVKETTAPVGYELNASVEQASVTSNSTYTLKTIHQEQEWKAKIFITKTDPSGNQLSGAVMDVYEWSEASGNYVKLKTMRDSGGVYEALNLPYTDDNQGKFKVIEAKNPTGYSGTYEKSFAMDLSKPVGSSQTFAFTDTAVNGVIRYKFIKVDEAGKPVAGCSFHLCEGDSYDYYAKRVAEWRTDSTGVYVLEGVLEVGKTYTLSEISRPSGYYGVDDYTFTVTNTSEMQEITLVNKSGYRCQITLTKQIAEDDIVWEHGDPTFIFKTTGIDYESKNHTFHNIVTLSKEVYDEAIANGWAMVDYGYADSVTLVFVENGIVYMKTYLMVKPGIYTTTEMNTIRYKLDSISGVSGGSVAADGKSVTFDMKNHDEAEATFRNKKVEQQNYSHTDSAVNFIGAGVS